jgi:hypothetical protein
MNRSSDRGRRIGPREVLADALLSRDDPRGLPFVYQLGRIRGESKTVIRKHWHDWVGPELGRLSLRRQSGFRRGMLEEIRVGPGSTPAWIYEQSPVIASASPCAAIAS